MEENTTYLYLHTKKGASEVFYVGIGNSKRPYRKYGRNEFWKRIVNKYDYEITILSDNLTWIQACEMEKYLIKYYGRRDLGEGTLVNMTDGGEGTDGAIRTAEWSAKISASKKGNSHSLGYKQSSETIAKRSKLMRGKNAKLTEDQVIEILMEIRENPHRGQFVILSRKYGVTPDTIESIKHRRTWKYINI